MCALYSPFLLLDLTTTNTDLCRKKGGKILSSSRSLPESDRQTVWDCEKAPLLPCSLLLTPLPGFKQAKGVF